MSRVSYLQKAEITYKTQAYHTDRMSSIFQTFWSRFWLRDLPQEQDTNAPWQDLFDELSNIIPQQPRVQIVLDNPAHLWHTIQRMKTHKAIGADGWYSEELHKLTWTMVVDLSTLLQKMWPHGLTFQQMQARTLLFEKCAKPQSMSHGRPITILGYLVRLASKFSRRSDSSSMGPNLAARTEWSSSQSICTRPQPPATVNN